MVRLQSVVVIGAAACGSRDPWILARCSDRDPRQLGSKKTSFGRFWIPVVLYPGQVIYIEGIWGIRQPGSKNNCFGSRLAVLDPGTRDINPKAAI